MAIPYTFCLEPDDFSYMYGIGLHMEEFCLLCEALQSVAFGEQVRASILRMGKGFEEQRGASPLRNKRAVVLKWQVLEERLTKVLREWKVELNEPSPACIYLQLEDILSKDRMVELTGQKARVTKESDCVEGGAAGKRAVKRSIRTLPPGGELMRIDDVHLTEKMSSNLGQSINFNITQAES
nr:hypothetical protein Iba_chr06fCG7550 [Ipomoea batatas]